MNALQITSTQNSRIKTVAALQQKASERRQSGLFIVEGQRELQHCIRSGLQVTEVYWCPAILPDAGRVHETCSTAEWIEVSQPVYDKIAYRNSTEGLIAVVRQKKLVLNDLSLPSNPLLVIVESVEKPGNLGAILRSADASGVDAVIVCDERCDIYNPNLIRSSIGAIFTVPCIACTSQDCIDYLKSKKIQILTAQLQDSVAYYDSDMTLPTAIIMGTESTGLTPQWRQAADAHIRIPMLGQLDSLNVSVSAAILMFEAVRQRGVSGE